MINHRTMFTASNELARLVLRACAFTSALLMFSPAVMAANDSGSQTTRDANRPELQRRSREIQVKQAESNTVRKSVANAAQSGVLFETIDFEDAAAGPSQPGPVGDGTANRVSSGSLPGKYKGFNWTSDYGVTLADTGKQQQFGGNGAPENTYALNATIAGQKAVSFYTDAGLEISRLKPFDLYSFDIAALFTKNYREYSRFRKVKNVSLSYVVEGWKNNDRKYRKKFVVKWDSPAKIQLDFQDVTTIKIKPEQNSAAAWAGQGNWLNKYKPSEAKRDNESNEQYKARLNSLDAWGYCWQWDGDPDHLCRFSTDPIGRHPVVVDNIVYSEKPDQLKPKPKVLHRTDPAVGTGGAVPGQSSDTSTSPAEDKRRLPRLPDPNRGGASTLEELCPCAGPAGDNRQWENHGEYMTCINKVLREKENSNEIDRNERSTLVAAAAQSNCGKPDTAATGDSPQMRNMQKPTGSTRIIRR